MTPAHTPAPWEVRRDMPEPFPRSPGEVIPFMVMAPRRGPIAEVFAPAGPGCRGQREANADLIAAAPDLAAVLLRYVELEESSAPHSSSPMREAARAALAKAGIE